MPRWRGRPRAGCREHGRRHDTGSSTVLLVVAVVAVALLATVTVGLLAAVATAHARAGVAADAAALAAASVAQRGGDGCLAAARLASAHKAELDSCDADAAGAVVTVTTPLLWRIGPTAHVWSVTGRARAGPQPAL